MILTGNKDAEMPKFEIMPFESKDKLFEYTSADNYTFQDGNKGVCYGFQLAEDSNGGYTLELFFND